MSAAEQAYWEQGGRTPLEVAQDRLAALEAENAQLREERDRLQTIHCSASAKWGMKLAEGLGDFLTKAAEGGPVTTKIVCKLPDGSDMPVVHFWATNDGNSPVARVSELRRLLDEANRRLAALASPAEDAMRTCARTGCQSTQAVCRHTQTGAMYCVKCARAINDYHRSIRINKDEPNLVELPDRAAPASEARHE